MQWRTTTAPRVSGDRLSRRSPRRAGRCGGCRRSFGTATAPARRRRSRRRSRARWRQRWRGRGRTRSWRSGPVVPHGRRVRVAALRRGVRDGGERVERGVDGWRVLRAPEPQCDSCRRRRERAARGRGPHGTLLLHARRRREQLRRAPAARGVPARAGGVRGLELQQRRGGSGRGGAGSGGQRLAVRGDGHHPVSRRDAVSARRQRDRRRTRERGVACRPRHFPAADAVRARPICDGAPVRYGA